MTASHSPPVAFFHLEGTLLQHDQVQKTALWIASQSPLGGEKLLRVSGALSSFPLGLVRGEQAPRLAWLACRGLSEDRLTVLAPMAAERLQLLPVGERLMKESKHQGYDIVWISSLTESVLAPLVRRHRPSLVLADRWEFQRGKATGRALSPEAQSYLGGKNLRLLAGERGWDLARARAYGSLPQAASLLAAVGNPCALLPRPSLRDAALTRGWPVVEAGGLP